jgi:hypothetical protein
VYPRLTFTVARLIEAFLAKVAGKFEKFGHFGKYCVKATFQAPLVK